MGYSSFYIENPLSDSSLKIIKLSLKFDFKDVINNYILDTTASHTYPIHDDTQ